MFNIYATDYAPVDPITPPCDITPIFIGYKGENKARCLIFDLTECVETFGDGGFVISFIRQGDDLPYLVTDTDRLDNNAIWIITDTDTAVDGYGMVQLQYIVDDVVCKSALYRTVTFDSNSITGDVPDPYEDLLAQIAAYAAQAEGAATTATAAAQAASTAVENGITTERSQRIAADEGLNTRINELMGLAGAPSMANSAAAMTDSSKVYVYTGSEAGYLTGHWYYYNGSEWADGGVYQATAVDTDKTLTVENMAADAAVVGDKIDECMAAFVTETTSGSIASFADGADGVPLKDLVVNIQPKQAGTGDPSPSNVRAISGYTEANISRTGKNLLPNNLTTQTKNGVTATVNADGTITVNGTATSGTEFILSTVTLAAGTYHFISAAGGSSSTYYMNFSGIANNYNRDLTYTISTEKTTTAKIILANGTTVSNITFSPQITFSTVENPNVYEPYNPNSTTYNISLSSAGTVYGGTLDVTTGMLTVTDSIMSFDGSFSKSGTYADCFYKTMNSTTFPYTTRSTTSLSNIYVFAGFGQNAGFLSQDNTYGLYRHPVNEPSLREIYVRDSRFSTAADFNAALATTPLTVCFKIIQPLSVQLSATEIRSLLGNNNIFADTGSVASCEYRADTKLYLEKLTNPDDDMVANANITSGQYFMVGNNLYLATANIANGGAITPGTNCTATNLAAALNAINS